VSAAAAAPAGRRHKGPPAGVDSVATPPERAPVWSDLPLLAAIAVAALAIRLYEPWHLVFTPTHVNMLDTDSWYHLRAIEYFVRNVPHHLAWDPYALAGGQYVPIAPLFDMVAGTAALIAGLGAPSTRTIETVAVFAPPLLGLLTVLAVYATGREVADSRTGLLAAALAAILPGHFLDRTLLGFVDHHALEALLSTAVLFILVRAIRTGASTATWGAALGGTLGAYMLTWTSAAFLMAPLLGWCVLAGVVAPRQTEPSGREARIVAIGAVVGLAIVLLLQDADLYRRNLQIASLAATAGVAAAIEVARALSAARAWNRRLAVIVVAIAVGSAIVVAAIVSPGLWNQIRIELTRFRSSSAGMQVLEARPLFFYTGALSFASAWIFFRSGFIAGLVALCVLMIRVIRRPNTIELLLVVWAPFMYAATIGQNRFGYYLVPIAALLTGRLSALLLDLGRRRGEWGRNVSVVAVAALVFSPSLVPAVWTTGRPAALSSDWLAALEWLRTSTPEPFGDPSYYYARYDHVGLRAPEYSVMNWWDDGYWIAQVARRVPASNPTQLGAEAAARFFTSTDESAAVAMLDRTRSRFVFAESLLALEPAADGGLTGDFASMAAFAGRSTAAYYEPFAIRGGEGAGRTIYLFFPEYYRTIAFRLVALGGGAGVPRESTSVVTWIDATNKDGSTSHVATGLRDFDTYEAAETYLASLGGGQHRIVGRNPMRPPVPVAALHSLRVAFRTPAAGSFGYGAAQVFEHVPGRESFTSHSGLW